MFISTGTYLTTVLELPIFVLKSEAKFTDTSFPKIKLLFLPFRLMALHSAKVVKKYMRRKEQCVLVEDTMCDWYWKLQSHNEGVMTWAVVMKGKILCVIIMGVMTANYSSWLYIIISPGKMNNQAGRTTTQSGIVDKGVWPALYITRPLT